MRIKLKTIAILLSFCLSVSAQSPAGKATQTDRLFSELYKDGQFSGAVLVAEHGKIIYKKGFGYANRKTKERFTPDTPCYIGSLTKQFVGMGIMILQEQDKLDYGQSIRVYFPELPQCMTDVTIRNLLNHTSGLVLFGDYPDMDEQNVFEILMKQQTLRFTPGEKFEYCNAGYTLLGLLIRKITGQSLNDFMTQYIFRPAGMKNTYVNSQSLRNRKRAKGYYVFGDENDYDTFIGGAASVVSTVNDLYQWDKMLYAPTIVSKKTLEKAFEMNALTFHSNVYGNQSYGFGWFISEKDGRKVIQHDGGFAGFRSYIERQPGQQNTIIYVSNVRHSLKDDIRTAINQILDNKPYSLPKLSWANKLMEQANTEGMEKAIAGYRNLKSTAGASRYYFSESEFNSLGYYLMRNKRMPDALQFFLLNTEENPNSANAFDSLGEAYMEAGNKPAAISNYKKSLALNPFNTNARDMIEKLNHP